MTNGDAPLSPVYFDHNATTPLDPRVAQAMVPWLTGMHGNPSSAHSFGAKARQAVERARHQVAQLLAADEEEVVFLGSGSEGNSMVLADIGRRWAGQGRVVVSAFEHPSVLRAAERLEGVGMEIVRVPPAADGIVPVAAVEKTLTRTTRLVCLMLANNELGTLQPVAEVAAACRRRGIPVLCDAVQAIGKVAVRPKDLGVDFLVLAGHKFHGPLGAAALWVREGQALDGLILGAAQERGLRAGTENVPALVGLGEACRWAEAELGQRQDHLSQLRQRLEEGLALVPEARIHCQASPRLPQTTNVAFPGVVAADLMAALDKVGFSVSTGAACSSGKPQPSAAMIALGVPPAEAVSSVRISLGMTNRPAEVDRFLELLPEEVARLRAFSASALAG
jgi:cysteine desulfurase